MQKSIYVYKNPPAGDHIQENQWLNCILSHSLDPSTIIDVVPENLFKPHKSSFGGDFLRGNPKNNFLLHKGYINIVQLIHKTLRESLSLLPSISLII